MRLSKGEDGNRTGNVEREGKEWGEESNREREGVRLSQGRYENRMQQKRTRGTGNTADGENE